MSVVPVLRRSSRAALPLDPIKRLDGDASELLNRREQALPAGLTAVAVVVPCYNEQGALHHLRAALLALTESLRGRYALEFLLVDDGSSDGTWRAAHDLVLRSGAFAGIAELLWQMDRRGQRIVEAPAELRVRANGQSKMRVARASWDHLKLLCRAAADRIVGGGRGGSVSSSRKGALTA